MKAHLLLFLALGPICTASATLLPLPLESGRSIHPFGIITGGFCTESSSGKTQEEARENAMTLAYGKYRGSNFKITQVTFSKDSFGYICHLDLEFCK